MKIKLPDGSLHVDVFLDRSESGYDDNVFVRITEECPERYKLFRGNQITIGITAADARKLAQQLVEVAEQDETAAKEEAAQLAGKIGAAPVRPRRRRPPVPFTSKQGKYLAFIHHYVGKFGCSPAEADVQRHFLVSAPTVNQMIQRLERLGLIARTPGQARSIRLLVPRELIPPL
jgi:hypothetical protein